MIKNKQNAEFYNWGDNCSGWHLVKSQDLSVIEEEMPAGTAEKKHFHSLSQQFFYILKGEATFELEDEFFTVRASEGFHILPGQNHGIFNKTKSTLKFIVISQPTSRGDRIEL